MSTKTSLFKKSVTLLFTAFLLAFSVSAAFAAEGGLFREMTETEYDDERLTILDQVAETISVSQTTGSVTAEVSQAYCEGNRIYISYKASGAIYEEDGLSLEDGSYADIIAGGSVQKDDGSIIGWKECIIPDNQLADRQTFCLVYRIPGSEEKQTLRFSLERHIYSEYLQGISPSTDYRAHAILYMGKVSLKGAVILTSPEQADSWRAWQEGEEGNGTDVIACWNLYQNGEPVSFDLFGASEVLSDGVAFSVMYPYMEDLNGLSLVPEYSDGGEKPEEAIVLEKYSIKSTIAGNIKTYHEMTDGTWMCDDQPYQYRLEINGRMPNAAKDSTFVYLSNREDISFEQAYLASGISSHSDDYFSSEEAVLVEMY